MGGPVIGLFFLGCSMGFAANIQDPLSRTGVWEATAIVKERIITFLLSLQMEAVKTQDGTFTVSKAWGRVSSADLATGRSGIGCFLLKEAVELDDQHVRGTCT